MRSLLIFLCLLHVSMAKVTYNSSITRMQGFPQETQHYMLTFKDDRLQELNITAAHDTTFSKYTHISDTHVQSIETMQKSQEKSIQDFPYKENNFASSLRPQR